MARMLILIPFIALCAFLGAHKHRSLDAPQNVYVSLIAKDAPQPPYFARFATMDRHLLVTPHAVNGAIKTAKITIKNEERLYAVELWEKNTTPLPGEIVRWDQFALVKLWNTESPGHIHLGNHFNFVKPIKLTQLKIPTISKVAPLIETQEFADDLIVSADYLKEKTLEFSGASAVVIDGATVRISERGSTNGRTMARKWLRQQYEALGYQVSPHIYRTGENFIAERLVEGATQTLVLSAHLDSVSNAGADDDGTGTVTVLGVANALKDTPLKMNLRVLGFDQEELGLVGSEYYAQDLQEQGSHTQIAGVLNVEMTAYDSDNDGAFHVIDCNEGSSATLSAAYLNAVTQLQLPLKHLRACTTRSDHASFWDIGVPAVVISQNFFGPPSDANPCYHRSCDVAANLNYDYMQKLSLALAHTTRSIAGAVAGSENK